MRKLKWLPYWGSGSIHAAIVIIALLGLCQNAVSQCSPNSGEISGFVFDDVDEDGLRANEDIAMRNVMVVAYDENGSSLGSSITDQDGYYAIQGLTDGTSVRLQFNYAQTYTVSTLGADNLTDVQLATVPACDRNLGLHLIDIGCSEEVQLILPCFVQGTVESNPDVETIITVPASFTSDTKPAKVASHGETGAVWGTAYKTRSKEIFTAAVVKQYAGLKDSHDAIFRIVANDNGMYTTSVFTRLSDLGIDVAPLVETDISSCEYGKQTGRYGLGALELSTNENYLYTVNISEKSVVRIPTVNPTTANTISYPVPNPNCGSDYQVFGLKYYQGKLYVGVTCTGENFVGTAAEKAAMSSAIVYQMDVATGSMTQVFETDYLKGYWDDSDPGSTATMGWLTDIDFTRDGNMILGIADRVGNRYCSSTSSNRLDVQNPDILLVYKDENGNWTLESNGQAGDLVGSGVGNGQGPSDKNGVSGEFFGEDHWPLKPLLHKEVALGSMIVLQNGDEVVAAVYDPLTNAYSGGLHRYSTTNGALIEAIELYSNEFSTLFGKATGFGDVVSTCTQSPIHIGNFVWDDLNSNGIQDAGELPLPGVDLVLLDSDCNIVGRTTTDQDGYYTFNSSNVDHDNDGNTDAIEPNSTYFISIDTDQFDGSLESVHLDNTDYIFSPITGDNALNNNATIITDVCESEILVQLTTPDINTNDFTFDIGLTSDLQFDLALMKQVVGNPFVRFGDEVEFKIEVTNQGNISAKDIEIIDYIPSGLTFSADKNPDWNKLDDNSVAYMLTDKLSVGETTAVSITLTANGAGTDYINVAEIFNASNLQGGHPNDIDSKFDKDQSNDAGGQWGTDTDDVITDDGNFDEDDQDPAAVRVFDLALKYELVNNTTYLAGDQVKMMVTVYNQGNVAADNFDVTVYNNPDLVLADANNDGWAVVNNNVVYNVDETLYPGQKKELCIYFNINENTQADEIVQVAEISNETAQGGGNIQDFDSTPDNVMNNDVGGVPQSNTDNTVNDHGQADEDDQDPVLVRLNFVDLALVKTTAQSVVNTGDVVVYDITVTNQGSLPVHQIDLVDYLPSGMTLVDADWNVTGSKAYRKVRLENGLAPDANHTVQISLQVEEQATGLIINEAEIVGMADDQGKDLSHLDIDSTPDEDANNDNGGQINSSSDDMIMGNGVDDEDDHDPAFVVRAAISVSPDVCEDNATNGIDGQYSVTITQTAPSGQTWYVAAASNLYEASSPEPPAAPTPLVVGASNELTETPLGGSGMSEYSIDVKYVEAQDYSITLSNGNPADDQIYANAALRYNDEFIVGPSSICKGSTATYSLPEILDATYEWELSSGGSIVSATDVNEITVEWGDTPGGPNTLTAAISTPTGCYAPAVLDVYLGDGGDVMSCYGDVNISLGADCQVEVTPAKISTIPVDGTTGFSVMLLDGNTPIAGNILTDAHIGKAITAKLIDGCGSNSCWSTVRVEDKTRPVIQGPSEVEINCYALDRSWRPAATDNCNSAVEVRETYWAETPLYCDNDYVLRVNATYVAEDVYGNVSEPFDVVLNVKRPDMMAIKFPEDLVISDGSNLVCGSFDYDDDDFPSIEYSGYPSLNGMELVPGEALGLCNIGVSIETMEVGKVECVTKYMRRFLVYEAWCTGGVLLDSTQIIEVLDDEAPTFYCGDDITASAGGGNCMATVYIPNLEGVEDNCSDNVTVQIRANNAQVQNNIASFPLGDTKVTYLVSDACGNIDSCSILVTVEDHTAPVVVCDRETTIGINSQGLGYAYAATFDDGSWDACGIDYMKVRRVDGGQPCGSPSSAYQDYVTFCCADVGRTDIMVELTVWDANNNSNSCMVTVEVQDKSDPILTCVPDRTITCQDDISDLTVYGMPTATDQCDVTITELSPIMDLTPCGTGTITRRFEASDNTNSVTCEQVLTVVNSDPFVFDPRDFPRDYETDQCNRDLLEPGDLPVGFSRPIIRNTECSMADATHSDAVFEIVSDSLVCYKIVRTWTILDWCQINDPYYTPFVADQIIKVHNTIAPIIAGTCAADTTITNDCNMATVTLSNSASDDCTPADDMSYTYKIDFDSDGNYESTINGSGSTVTFSADFEIGEHQVEWTWKDGCGNTTTCLQDVVVIKEVNPVASCRDVIIALQPMDLDGDGFPDAEMACLPIDSINLSSYHPCGDTDLEYSFSSDVNDDTLKLDCSHLRVTNTFEFWVTDNAGNTDICYFNVEVQDNNDVNICADFDLALIKTLNTTTTQLPVQYGDDVTFDITVCNQGAFNADTVIVTDYIPAGFVLNDSDWTAGTAGSTGVSASVILNSGDELPVGGLPSTGDSCVVVPITLTLQPGADPSDLLNYAEISRGVDIHGGTQDVDSTPDDDNTNDGSVLPGDPHDDSFEGGVDEDDYDVATVPIFDLAIIKTTDATGPFALGDQVTFDITIFNQGNVAASNIALVDYIPCGLSLSAGNSGWTLDGGVLRFTYTGVLAPGQSDVVSVTMDIQACNDADAYVNFAEIAGATDSDGNAVVDIDSSPDQTNGNDAGGNPNGDSDDTNSGDGTGTPNGNDPTGDEDDHDPAILDLMYCDLCTAATLEAGDDIAAGVDMNSCSATVSVPLPTIGGNSCNEDLTNAGSFIIRSNGTVQGPVQGLDASGVYPVGTTVVVYTLNSICGTATDSLTITVSDDEGPLCTAFTHPDIVLTNDDPVGFVNTTFILSQFNDVCGDVDESTLVVSQESFDCSDVANSPITISITVSDNSGNVTTCQATINIEEDIAPECNAQDIDAFLDENGQVTVLGVQINDGSSDDCGFVFSATATPANFDCSNIGPNTVTLTVTDNNGNSSTCESTVTVLDTISPTCSLQDITVSLTGATVTVDASELDFNSSDACDTELDFLPSTFTFDCGHIGDTLVTVTVVDDSGNSSNCQATITVVDNSTIMCQAIDTLIVYADSTGTFNITPDMIDQGSSTGCNANPMLSLSNTLFGCNNLGDTITIQLTVSDGNNSVSCPSEIILLDTIAPSISINDITIECEDIGTVPFGDATVDFDNMCLSSLISFEETIDSSDINVCGIGTLTRTIIATDPGGNSDTTVQRITISNTDNVFGLGNIVWPVMDTTITCDQTTGPIFAGSPVIDVTGVDCSLISIDSTVMDLNPGICPDSIQKVWTVVDSCQLDGSGAGIFTFTQTIEVIDTVAPIITGPVGIGDTIFGAVDPVTCLTTLSLFGSATDCENITVSNNGSGALDNNSLDASGDYGVGTETITLIATDVCGNQSTYEYVVSIADTTELVFGCNKLFVDIPDTLTVDVHADEHIFFFSGFDCEDPADYSVSYSFGDPNDTIRTFDCDDVGDSTYFVHYYFQGMWIDSCKTLITIQDPNGFCPTTLVTATISGDITTVNGDALEGTYITLMGSQEDDMTDVEGHYAFADMPTGGTYTVHPENNNDVDKGVSTLDLVLIQRHILGIQRFDDPFEFIAADINNSSSISGQDVVTLRKLILGKITEFPDNTSWRMVNQRQQFGEAEDALESVEEEMYIPRFNSNIKANFTAVKVGDVNGSVEVELGGRSTDWLRADQVGSDVNFIIDRGLDLRGFQTSVRFDAEIVSISSDAMDLSEVNYHIDGNVLTISWYDLSGVELTVGDELLAVQLDTDEAVHVDLQAGFSSEWYLGEDLITRKIGLRSDDTDLVTGLKVSQNTPNPWSGATNIEVYLAKADQAKLTVTDVAGKVVYTSNKACVAGRNYFRMNSDDLPSGGVYVYTITTGSEKVTKRMILVK